MEKQKYIPLLRFPEFKEEWKKELLVNLSENGFSNGLFNDPKKVGKGYRLINVKDMYVGDTINVNNLTLVDVDEKEFKKNKVEFGDIFFTRSSLVKEGIAHSNVNLSDAEDLTFDGHLIRMRPNKSISSPSFLAYNFTAPSVRSQFIKKGKTTTMTTIGQEDIASVEIVLPILPEQQKIANFLTSVDSKLTQLKQKKTLLEQYKKGIMQKIFSQEIRFKDENGKTYPKWAENRFGDIFSFRPTNSFSRDNLNYETGEVLNIHYGDIHTKFHSQFDITKETVPYINGDISINKLSNDSYCKEGDLIIADASEDYADIGKSIEIVNLNNKKVVAGLHTLHARPNLQLMSIGFSSFLMKSSNVRLQIKTIAQGTKVLSISTGRLSNILLLIPCVAEQTKIINFLSALDDKISHCSTQIEKMEVWKKGLLQRMFC